MCGHPLSDEARERIERWQQISSGESAKHESLSDTLVGTSSLSAMYQGASAAYSYISGYFSRSAPDEYTSTTTINNSTLGTDVLSQDRSQLMPREVTANSPQKTDGIPIKSYKAGHAAAGRVLLTACETSGQTEVDLDSIIDRLLEVRGSRPGKQIQLLDTEIRFLCTKAREIFISQPMLLELEAPIRVNALLSLRGNHP